MGTPQGWGHHRDGDATGTGTPWGWGRERDRDTVGMGMSQGQGHRGDGDTVGMETRPPVTFRRHRSPPQDADIRELPRAGAASAAFTFFRSYKDGLWRFESAANPGWFLCTSARGHQPLGLSRHPDATHLLDFYFQLC
uniref:Interleukin-1 receptor antagonist protein n=1 Tax=Accipiter nisus TaxID=211598 RepID=A0A8B9MZE1_9AVES